MYIITSIFRLLMVTHGQSLMSLKINTLFLCKQHPSVHCPYKNTLLVTEFIERTKHTSSYCRSLKYSVLICEQPLPELFVQVFSDLAFFCAEDEGAEKIELKHSYYIRGRL